MKRTDVTFDSGGESCAAWLYRPDDAAGSAPCVVMAHGFGGVREARLDAYAERFAAAGMAALVFDYRHFGASGGEPRQLLDIRSQLADWAAAVDFARGIDGVDPERIALWGTSFSGGHVVVTGARDGRVAAVVSQCPFADGRATMGRVPAATTLRVLVAAVEDEIRGRLGRPPRLLKLVGPPGSVAAMTSPDAEPGYRALVPPGADWPEEVAARIALRVGFYRPGRSAPRLACPLLVCVCDADSVAPAGAAVAMAESAPRGELRRYPIGHFDVYVGEPFEKAVADQTEFLRRHLGLVGA